MNWFYCYLQLFHLPIFIFKCSPWRLDPKFVDCLIKQGRCIHKGKTHVSTCRSLKVDMGRIRAGWGQHLPGETRSMVPLPKVSVLYPDIHTIVNTHTKMAFQCWALQPLIYLEKVKENPPLWRTYYTPSRLIIYICYITSFRPQLCHELRYYYSYFTNKEWVIWGWAGRTITAMKDTNGLNAQDVLA